MLKAMSLSVPDSLISPLFSVWPDHSHCLVLDRRIRRLKIDQVKHMISSQYSTDWDGLLYRSNTQAIFHLNQTTIANSVDQGAGVAVTFHTMAGACLSCYQRKIKCKRKYQPCINCERVAEPCIVPSRKRTCCRCRSIKMRCDIRITPEPCVNCVEMNITCLDRTSADKEIKCSFCQHLFKGSLLSSHEYACISKGRSKSHDSEVIGPEVLNTVRDLSNLVNTTLSSLKAEEQKILVNKK
jgi:hypothetical protein